MLRKLRYVPPNLSTSASLLLGLLSIYLSTHGQLKLAAWCICWCVLLDKLDGTLARLLRAQSSFGVEFDSFADFCSFGLAPAALLLHHAFAKTAFASGTGHYVMLSAAGFYGLLTAMRLARYNVQNEAVGGDRLFFGLPSTMSGGLIASGYLVLTKHLPGFQPEWVVTVALPGVLFLNGLLMVSRLPLPKLRVRRSRWFNYFQAFNIVAAYSLAALMLFPEYLFGAGLAYAVIGFYFGRRTARAVEDEVRAAGAVGGG